MTTATVGVRQRELKVPLCSVWADGRYGAYLVIGVAHRGHRRFRACVTCAGDCCLCDLGAPAGISVAV